MPNPLTVQVVHGGRDGQPRQYPRCQWEESPCQMGASWLIPVDIELVVPDWRWLLVCANHYVRWQSLVPSETKWSAGYRLHPVERKPHVRSGDRPRS